jgi:hypothetical protein
MPRKSRREEIEQVIREHLKDAVKGKLAITDESLMKVAQCSRRTFYKYVHPDSPINNEIEQARRLRKRLALSENTAGARGDHETTVKRLRDEVENAKNGARNLMASQAQFVSNLIDLGVPISIIERAQREAMAKPDRSVTRAGYPRNRTGRKRRFT